jgi:signal transduction histidine kinase
MIDQYFLSLLVVGGVCVGFVLHAASLAVQTRLRRYLYLLLLALLEAAYCILAWRYFSLKDGALARPWGQAFCAFMPYITCIFGELTMDLTECRPRWLTALQKANWLLTTTFASSVVLDMVGGSSIMLRSEIRTDLASLHRHQFVFTTLGQAYLAWVSFMFSCYAVTLFRSYRARRDLFPMVLGSVLYFSATVSDFCICVGFFDGPFTQHFGFFALVAGCWRVLSNRFEVAIGEMRQAVKRLEDQRNQLLIAAPMLHKQKLDSLGTLAAGVAHEINNPIQGIMNYASLLKRQLRSDAVASNFADEIACESKRVAEIVQSLLRFGRADSTLSVAADISEILEGTLTLIRTGLINDGIQLTVRIQDPPPEITCRAAQLQQVLMNLVTNARDALLARDPERTEDKTITIVVSRRMRDGEPWLAVEVSDTGDGFDPALADRLFEPFFTTKGAKGTGLGLSVSHGIILAHGGTITGESTLGQGARFCIQVPCRPPAAIAERLSDSSTTSVGSIAEHREQSSPSEGLIPASVRGLRVRREAESTIV